MNKAPWIIIATLLIVIFLQRIWLPPQHQTDALVTSVDTIHDTIPYPVTVYKPKLVYKDTGTTKWRSMKIDTLEILAEYYARHYYVDTLVNDSQMQIIVCDTISQNKIIFRKPILTVYTQTIKQTTVVKPITTPRRKIFAGMGIGRNPEQFGLIGSLIYSSKADHLYSVSFDILNHDIYFSIYWKIRFK